MNLMGRLGAASHASGLLIQLVAHAGNIIYPQELFREASGLATETKQVSMLLYTMGEEAEDTLLSTKISESDRKTTIR